MYRFRNTAGILSMPESKLDVRAFLKKAIQFFIRRNIATEFMDVGFCGRRAGNKKVKC
jgi:hypothetical protein